MNELEKEWQTADNGFQAGVDFKTWLANEVVALRTAARALLAAVDYRYADNDRDVRIRDLWGAAWALREIERALAETQ